MASRLLTLRTRICNAKSFPGRRLISQPWLCPTASTMSHVQSKSTPGGVNFWPFFAFATGALFFYYSKNQPLLCEAPVSSDKDLEEEVSGSYESLFGYPTFKYLNSWFSDHGISILGDPGKGLLRYDDFSMIAREPRQEHTIGVSAGDWDADGYSVPNSLAWASWGVVDGHRFGHLAPLYAQEILIDLRQRSVYGRYCQRSSLQLYHCRAFAPGRHRSSFAVP